MKGRKIFLSTVFFCFLCLLGKAQAPYVTDPGYVKDTLHTDEFDFNYMKSWKWWVPDTAWSGDMGIALKQNLIFSGGQLAIKIDSTYKGPFYKNGFLKAFNTGGMVEWIADSVKYGYLEMYAKVPIGNARFWPSLWMWEADCDTTHPGTSAWYEEIDVMEVNILESFFGNQYDGNRYVSNPVLTSTLTTCPSGNQWVPYNVDSTIHGGSNLAAYHKYGALWTPDSVVYYFDDARIRKISTYVPQHHIWIIIGIGMSPWVHGIPVPKLNGPKYMYVDYIRYYKKMPDCSTDKLICSPSSDYYNASPPRAVEKTIVTGGSGCGGSPSVTFNTSDNCTLRATNSITLDAGTTVNPDDSGYFIAMTEACPP